MDNNAGNNQRGFITDRLPALGTKVVLLCTKDGHTVELALLCAWSEDGWIVAGTKRRIVQEVIGWRSAKAGQVSLLGAAGP